jgi:hypothetical protein
VALLVIQCQRNGLVNLSAAATVPNVYLSTYCVRRTFVYRITHYVNGKRSSPQHNNKGKVFPSTGLGGP